MKLFHKKKKENKKSKWIVFNYNENSEFAECENCGTEIERSLIYPQICPGCKCLMDPEYIVAD